MPTVTDCLKKLQESLQAASPGNVKLNEKYDGELDDPKYSESVFEGLSNFDTPYISFKQIAEGCGEVERFKKYSSLSLQAAWNIAAILKKVNVESNFGSYVAVGQTGFKLIMNGKNGKRHADNLLANLHFLDAVSVNGVPYIIDEVTYNINKAISTFIEEMKSISHGQYLISLSSDPDHGLGSLSFTNMQKAANERMAAYDQRMAIYNEFIKQYPEAVLNGVKEANTETEAGTDSETASTRSERSDENDELEFQDTLSDIDSSSSDDEDELDYYDAPEGDTTDQSQEQATTFVSEALSSLETRNDDANQDSEQEQYYTTATTKLNNVPPESRTEDHTTDQPQEQATTFVSEALSSQETRSDDANHDSEQKQSEIYTTDQPQDKIKQLAATFVSEALSNLKARSNDANQDSEQKEYCAKATTTLNNFLSVINNSENLDSIIQYMETSNSQLTDVFAQNRSQTWFKKNISEPFESFKIAINNVLKSFGIAAQLPLSSTQTLKKFNDFKKEYQKIIEVQAAPDNAADQRIENAAPSSAKPL